MKHFQQAEAFVLAGGGSKRMGRDKALLEFQGLTLITCTARLAHTLVENVTIVGSPARYAALGWHTIQDQDFALGGDTTVPAGPLAGIATALSATSAPWNLILACDLPYLTSEWLDWLLARAVQSAAEIVVPRTRRGLEPLAAVYRRECAAPLVAELRRGARKVTDALATCQLEVVQECEWRKAAAHESLLTNMNTPSDYEDAQRWWSSRER